MWVTGRTIGVLVTLGVMVALPACGGPSGDQGTGDRTLTIGVSYVPKLDPGQAAGRIDNGVLSFATGTLTTENRDGKGVSMGLAESVTPGDKRYVVKLKPNLKFSDGSPLTATDLVASFEHMVSDKTSGYLGRFTRIGKVTAVDDLTVNIDLKQPYPSLPFVLALPVTGIIPAKFIEAKKGKDLWSGEQPPTAGQFQVESFDENQITLKANPNYGGPKPSTKTIVFKKIVDPTARLAQVQSGQIDFADTISFKQAAQLAQPVALRSSQAIIGATFLLMNNRPDNMVSDVRIRQAIAVAVDRKQINQVAYAGKNSPALSLWGSTSKWNEPFLPADPDLARAKALLAGTKCANGCKLNLVTDSSDDSLRDTATVVQQNLKAIGIQSNIQAVDSSTEWDRQTKGNYDLLVTFAYDTAEYPDGYLNWVLGGEPDTGYSQYSFYSTPEMIRLVKQTYVTSGSARDAAIQQVNALYEKDLPYAPLVNYVTVSASRVPSKVFDLDPSQYYHVD